MSKLGKITRRTFLVGSAAIAGGVAFGVYKYKQPIPNPLLKTLGEGQAAITPYVLIDKSGISVIAARSEMGQGVYTTLGAMVAEELEVALEDINVIHGPASVAYYNSASLEEGLPIAATDTSSMANMVRENIDIMGKFMGLQLTGGSSSVPDGFEKMRMAGATARETLKAAAAKTWGLPVEALTAQNGQIIAPDGKTLAYTELAEAAATIELPYEPALKPQSEWKLLGKSQPRVDAVEKSTGTAEYGIDVQLPDMLYATIVSNPHRGGKLNSFEASTAKTMPGVQDIFEIENGVAVIATNTWLAFNAAKQITFDWDPADYPTNTAAVKETLQASFTDERLNAQNRNEGDVDSIITDDNSISGEYFAPFLAHASMEPLNATAWFRDGKIDLWTGHQWPTLAVQVIAQETGLSEDNIALHVPYLGGGFGRRAEPDLVRQATKLAIKLQGRPVKLTWTREEDTTHDFYRPMATARFSAVMGDDKPEALKLEVAASSVVASQMVDRAGLAMAGPDPTVAQAIWDQPYGIANYQVTSYTTPVALPIGSWRSVGASQNAFFQESILDELASAKNLDPLQMRLDMMTHEPSRKVLETVKAMSNWGSPLPEGHARGVAFCIAFGVPTAEVVEISMADNKVSIEKVYAAVDVGTALDPRIIESQVVSAVNFGLTAAMMNEITIKEGKVEQTNYHDHGHIRMYQAPKIEVKVLENMPRIRGIGEPGTPPAAPALANAIFAATGQRIRELPLNKTIDFV